MSDREAPKTVRRGFVPRRANTTAKRAPPEVIAAYSAPPPTNQVEPVNLPRTEVVVAPPAPKPKRRAAAAVAAAPPVPKDTASDTRPRTPRFETAVGKLPVPAEKKEQILKDYATDKRTALRTYEAAQAIHEEKGHYLTDITTYIPQTRRAFYPFILESYQQIFGLPAGEETIDPEACQKLMAKGQQAVEAFLYQRFVKEYLRQSSPYRGLLVYHGLGSGKTCSSIAAAEALYGVANKRIIVMTPSSLRANFLRELTFCGFRHFSTNNNWVALPRETILKKNPDDPKKLISTSDYSLTHYMFAKYVLSLSDGYIDSVIKKSKVPIWIPDFTAPPNFDTLSPTERDQIRAQIANSLSHRITFINYNGISADKLKYLACARRTEGKTIFDDAVIVVDEIHNLVRLMQGTILPFLQERPGKRKRKIAPEPVKPGNWIPGLCESSLNYGRGFLFYRLLTDAKNAKIIGLSGTPLINFPEELGILTNLLGGYIQSMEFRVASRPEELATILENDPRTDYVDIKAVQGGYQVTVSIFQEGYTKVRDDAAETGTGKFIGVRHTPDAQETIEQIYERISGAATEKGITMPPLSGVSFTSIPRLPPDDETFRNYFIDMGSSAVANEELLKKRLTGLVSYYRGSKKEFMPEVIEDTVVECPMSDWMLSQYAQARKDEITKEASKKSEPKGDDLFAAVEFFSKKKNPSSYRFRSRALCNFAFPKSIVRPFPDAPEETEEVVPVDDLDVADRQSEALDAAADTSAEVLAEIEREEAEAARIEEAERMEQEEEEAANEALSVGAEAVAAATAAPDVLRARTYQERLQLAMRQLREQREMWLRLSGPNQTQTLANYSPKLAQILERIAISPGPVLFYSQFKTVEGLGVAQIAMEANGYEQLIIDETDRYDLKLSPASIASIKKGPAAVPRIITFTGEGSREQRAAVLAIFNGNFSAMPRAIKQVFDEADAAIADKSATYAALGNRHGEICKVIGITGAGAEGISLKCVRQVHILEPYWNQVRLDQVKGRAIRICSHADLPPNERNVSIFTYVTVFAASQVKRGEDGVTGNESSAIGFTLSKDNGETSDQKVFNVSSRKQAINDGLLKVMKEAAVDCLMNAPDNDPTLQCFITTDTDTSKPMFIPDLALDKIETDADTMRRKLAETDVRAEVAEETGSSAAAAALVTRSRQTIVVDRIQAMIAGEQRTFTTKLKDALTGLYEVFDVKDLLQSRPLGTVYRDPISGYRGLKLRSKE